MRRLLKTILLAVPCLYAAANAQQPMPTPDDTIRINTDLIQTAISVTDKSGRFVEGLKMPDFTLKVDGKARSVSFLEEVTAGASREKQLRPGSDASTNTTTSAGPRGRTILFFLDDLHLSPDSIKRTREMLVDFVDKKMRDDDVVAIASAKGTIGFLQQFTDNRAVLHAAIDRIVPVPYVVPDPAGIGAAPMTEFNALTIERKDDSGVLDYYVGDCVVRGVMAADSRTKYGVKEACTVEVKNRARSIILQAGTVTEAMYISLEYLLDTAGRMSGSKLAFLMSDGFLSDTGPRGRISIDRVGKIVDKARKAGVVIYSIDARGTVSGTADATGTTPMDANGRLESATLRAIPASQDALNALAVDTGGRALRNQNYFSDFVGEAVAETSRYYLVAWRPETDDPLAEKSKSVEITIPGREDLTVRAGKGFLRSIDRTALASKPAEAKKPGDDIKNALTDVLPTHALPIDLSVVYFDTPGNGAVLTSSIQIPSESLSFGPQRSEPAKVTVAGVVLDDRGKPAASFGTGLKIDPPKTGESQNSGVIYNYPAPLKPGIYQVRAVARDDRTNIIGGAAEWLIVPDIATKDLTMSSLLLGFESIAAGSGVRSQWSVDHHFFRNEKLRFMGFVYNAARDANGKADLDANIRIRRDGVDQSSPSLKKIILDAGVDLARIPLVDVVNIQQLTPGRYTLELTVDDRIAQKRTTQAAVFFVN